MTLNKKVADNISRLRREHQFSQERLAFEAGLDRSYISTIESGKANLTLLTLEKIAQVLTVDPCVLLT